MTAPSLLDELEGVVRLADKATPGPWEVGNGGKYEPETRVYCDDSLGSAVATCHHECTVAISHAQEIANAKLVATAVNFIRAHHAEIAAMAKRLEAAERDAARYRWLRQIPSVAGERAIGTVVDEGVCMIQGVALDAAIDAAMPAPTAAQSGEPA